MPISPLALLTLVSAALAIAGAPWALGESWLHAAFKPLTTALIVGHAWSRGRHQPPVRRWVLCGLALSLLGDVALLWPQRGFLPGLVAFLLAHLAYIVAFTREHRLLARPVALTIYVLVAGTVLALLWPSVPPGLRVPVAGYVLALTAMSAQTAVVGLAAQGDDRRSGRLLMFGGALFMMSDALLATNRFALPLPAASLWILTTYWAAQWCIASWLKATPGRFGEGSRREAT
ncbi:MAG TPA: lysoplasmalogenase [Burkholderiaceae bacterium]|nr:lysoplasmalogenase [Burkholderiaceae bacterium]